MKGGWLKIWRQLEDWEYFDDPIRLRAWLKLLFKAEPIATKKWGKIVERGQILTTYSEMATWFKCAKSTVDSVLRDFIESNQIRTQSERKFTMITICNYDSYQDTINISRTQTSTQISTQISTPIYKEENKEDKNENNKCAGAQKKKKPALNNSDMIFKKPTIEEIKDYATEKGRPDFDAEFFWNYYESNGWKVGRNAMKKWTNTVSMWISRDKKGIYNNSTNNNSNGTKQKQQPISDSDLIAAVKIGINLAQTENGMEGQ